FEAVNNIKPSPRGELEISDAHQYLLDKGCKVTYSEITGWWKDTGKPEDLLEANRLILENLEEKIDAEICNDSKISGKVIAGKNSKIINSNIRGPVIIGDNTVVENAYIGPFTSLGNNCEIKNTEVEFSILLDGCKIIDLQTRIESSLIGANSEIKNSKTKPVTHKLIIGDHSLVEIV
ncbi:MAG: glucose-1-phosphate thymidylyltransferase, partial [Calditrichia bacterium]|nr:glucose-1-phosphate thymidylyltransferase [Calditrichia bacterium]